ncbi:hypothetical protein [Paenibacillus macquariensis]|uniref:HEPN AbiU2-like domain-containing protein n=1 Tax=Paenibacillus macquariensis TaxID=948756 RepID=A0ABY1JK62_9BACL|nr:hypothetical protein [Paenibacillus macquariensis]MEC0089866.1 hypothetical protein [Paenibacillus macquariensis]OAB30671.1 hypothetical protein PMSM_21230 [Paenibacillus macquariensis subsp. macquariensis]SIQ32960.1 hypothetical protein SAMN05421578_101246 [Paenibacillus macquariensis]
MSETTYLIEQLKLLKKKPTDTVFAYLVSKTIDYSEIKSIKNELNKLGWIPTRKAYDIMLYLANTYSEACIVFQEMLDNGRKPNSIRIAKNEQVKSDNILKLALHNRIQYFNTETNNKYESITQVLNRNIRNADSHNTIKYSGQKNCIEIKKRVGNKTEIIEVSIDDWFLNVYPKTGWLVQAFIYSIALISLGISDIDLFREKYVSLFG